MRTISFFFLIIAISYTQSTKTVDVIYLNDGSIFNGEILEIIPNETVKIETNSGNGLVFKMSTVKSIKQETKTVTILKMNKQYPDYDLSYNPNKYTLQKNIGRIGGGAIIVKNRLLFASITIYRKDSWIQVVSATFNISLKNT